MKVKGGPNKACAACKFQRRRCSSDCSLAPFFPADQPEIFHNVHRLFGVSKVVKILKKMKNHDQKIDAMKSIIYESKVRKKFPVHGCYGVITQLHQELQQAIEELHYVRAQLAMLRENNSPSSDQIINSYDLVSEFNYSDQSGDQTKSFINLNNYISDVINDTENNKSIEIQNQFVDSSHTLALDNNIRVGEVSDQDYDYMNFNAIDDQPKEACESSRILENELKSAAAYFRIVV